MATITVTTDSNVDTLTRAGIATTAVTSVGTTATLTSASAHDLFVGDTFTVSGVTPAAYNGTYTVVTVPTTSSLTYTFAGGVGSATVQGTLSSAWQNGDDLVINNNATVTVNTNQTKFWNTVAVNIGKLYLRNTSTTTPIRFLTGRRSRLSNTDRTITLANGLAVWQSAGDWISLGTGSGAAGQTFTLPTSDYHASIWVETGAGTGVYEIWTNLADAGSAQQVIGYAGGLQAAGKGALGKFFVQSTADFSTLTQGHGWEDVFASTITVGDGTYGAVIPAGANVRVPNIIVQDAGEFGQQSTSVTNGLRQQARFVMTGAGIFISSRTNYAGIALDGSQAQSITITDSMFHVPPLITKCYAVNINGMGTGPGLGMLRASAYTEQTWTPVSITSSGTTCTVTTPTAHGFVVGQFVTIAGSTNAPNNYNGTYAITGVTSTTFTYTNATTPSGTTATGTLTVADALRVTSITSVGHTATVTTPYPHLLSVGDRVIVNGASAPYATNSTNGRLVLSVPSSTTFTYQTDTVGSGTATGTINLQRYAWTSDSDHVGNNTRGWSQCVDAVIQNAVFINKVNSSTGGTSLNNFGAVLNLDASDRAALTNCTFINVFRQKAAMYGLRISNSANCTITNCKFIGATISLTTSVGTTISGCSYAPWIGNYGCLTGNIATTLAGIARDPATGNLLTNGTRYYVRLVDRRSFYALDYAGTATRGYAVSRTYSATPYVGASDGPLWVSATPSDGNVIIRFSRKDPSPGTGGTIYEIYRSTSWGTLGSVVNTITTAQATAVTNTEQYVELFNDTGVSNGTTYFYTVRKYQAVPILITSMTASGTTITVTTATPHGLSVNQVISTFGGSPAAYNRLNTTVVSVINSTQFTFTASSAPATTPSSGNAQYLIANTGTFVDSAQQEATPTAIATTTNLILQSDTLATSPWVTTGLIRTNAGGTSTAHEPLFSANTVTSTSLDTLLYGSDQTVSQPVTVSAATAYTFSGFLRLINARVLGGPPVRTIRVSAVDNASSPVTATADVVVSFGTSTRFAVPITTGAGATTLTVTIGGNNTINRNNCPQVGGTQVNTGLTAGPLVASTTTTSLSSNEGLLDVTTTTGNGAVAFGIAAMAKDGPEQIQFRLGTAPTNAGGMRYTEVHLGTSPNFTPTRETLVWHAGAGGSATAAVINIDSGCASTSVTNLTQLTYAGVDNAIRVNTSSVSSVVNSSFYFGGGAGRVLIDETAATGNNIFVADTSFDDLLAYPRTSNYNVAASTLTTANNSGNVVLQNVRSTSGYDTPYNVRWQATQLKGCFGGYLTMVQNNIYKLFGVSGQNSSATISTGIAYDYTAQFDYIFNEFYDSATTGNLTLLMNASTKSVKPYTVVSGSPSFLNDGTILFGTAGDSMEWVWPNKIYGVSGFRTENLGPNNPASCYIGYAPTAAAIGTANHNDGSQRLSAIKLEYAIDTGAGYGAYKRLNAANLTAETVSATDGFNLKLRMTAMTTIPFQAPAAGTAGSDFVVGETINGATSNATAVVDEVVSFGTCGHLWVSSVVGTFAATENLRSGVTVRARTEAAPNTVLPINNQATANTRVGILRIFTNVDQSVKYATTTGTLTFTNLQPNSEVRVFKVSDGSELAGVESTSGTYTVTYDYFGTPLLVNIAIVSLAYQDLMFTNYALNGTSQSILVSQVLDRQYNNP